MVKHLSIHFLLILAFLSMKTIYADLSSRESIIVTDLEKKILYQKGNIEKRISPCCTFNIALSLMGYDSGVLLDELTPEWPYHKEYSAWINALKTPHSPQKWIQNSCNWFSQKLTKKLEYRNFKNYVALLQYGNQDTSGDLGKNNGLTHCWLSSSLKISPIEQIVFLQKLLKQELPFSSHAHEMTKCIFYNEDLSNGWQLYGKTGTGCQTLSNGSDNYERQFGWFVGWATKQEKTILFALLIQDQKKEVLFAGHRAKELIKKILLGTILSN